MGSAEAGELMVGLFGKRTIVGAGAVASAMGDTAGGFSSLLDTLKSADGAAQQTAETMDAGLGGTFRRVLSAVEGTSIAIGEALAPAFTAIEQAVTAPLGMLASFIEQNGELVRNIAISVPKGFLYRLF